MRRRKRRDYIRIRTSASSGGAGVGNVVPKRNYSFLPLFKASSTSAGKCC